MTGGLELARAILDQGVRALAWTTIGGLAGLVLGAVVAGGAFFVLLRGASARRSGLGLAALWVVLVIWLVALPLGLSTVGASFGLARAAADLARGSAWVDGAADLAVGELAAALRRLPASEAEEAAAAIAFLEGREPVSLANVQERVEQTIGLWRRQSERVGEEVDGWLDQRLEDERADRWARWAAARVLRRLDELSLEGGGRWLEPVLVELRSRGHQRVGGREVTAAIARIHVQEPLARTAAAGFRLQGWAALAVTAALVLLPAPLLLVGRRRAEPAELTGRESVPASARERVD